MFLLRLAQDPKLHFKPKKSLQKFDFMAFFGRILQNSTFTCFSSSISFISELRPNTESVVYEKVQEFHRLPFSPKPSSSFYFWGKKRMEKLSYLFLICSSYFSELKTDTQTIRSQKVRQKWWLVFVSFVSQKFCHHTIERFCLTSSATSCREFWKTVLLKYRKKHQGLEVRIN